MKSNKGWLEYNRDAVIQFRHPDQADHALKVINETKLGNTKNNWLVAERHFEEFNLRALDEHPRSSKRGPRVSIAADQIRNICRMLVIIGMSLHRKASLCKDV